MILRSGFSIALWHDVQETVAESLFRAVSLF